MWLELKVPKFEVLYNLQGPIVHFFGGEIEDLGEGVVIGYPYRKHYGLLGPPKLKKIRKRDITLRLPHGKLNARKMRWLSVWCDLFEISFGHVLFP